MHPRPTHLVAACTMLLAFASPAFGATIEPNTTADTVANDGQCSLREALTAAFTHAPSGTMAGECVAGDGSDTVKLGPDHYVLTRVTPTLGGNENDNLNGDFDIRSSLTLEGAGAASTTIDANLIDRAIEVRPGATVTIQGVTVTRGRGPSTFMLGAVGVAGGGILADGPQTLTIRDSIVTDNRAGLGGAGAQAQGGKGANGGPGQNGAPGAPGTGMGGAPGGSGGGIAAGGPLVVERTIVSNNQAGTGGGAGRGVGGNGGNGGVNGAAPGNGGTGAAGTGGPGGPGGPGGGISSLGRLTLVDSTVTGNTSGVGGIGGQGFGGNGGSGGTSSSFQGGNGGPGGAATGGNGGPGGNGGAVDAEGGADISGSTIDLNSSGRGGEGGTALGGNGNDGTFANGHGGDGGAGTAGRGGAGGRFAGLDLAGPSNVTNTTVTAQTAALGGKGGDANGGRGGLANGNANGGNGGDAIAGDGGPGGGSAGVGGFGPAVTLTQMTISSNAAGAGGGPGGATAGDGRDPGGHTGATTAGTSGPAGTIGGVDGTPRLANSIVASNNGGNCMGTVVDGGHNDTFGDATCPGIHGNPLLGDLRDNGGPTHTQSIDTASAAVDIVPANGAGCAPVDQRGVARPLGRACDAGAFERDAVPEVPSPPPVSSPPPPPVGTTPSPRDTTAPMVLSASVAPARFTLKHGTIFRFALSETARVSVSIDRAAAGRKVGKACRAASRTNRRHRHCTRFVHSGGFALSAAQGTTRKHFSGRIARKALRPGSYRATLVATDAAGNASRPRTVRFSVMR